MPSEMFFFHIFIFLFHSLHAMLSWVTRELTVVNILTSPWQKAQKLFRVFFILTVENVSWCWVLNKAILLWLLPLFFFIHLYCCCCFCDYSDFYLYFCQHYHHVYVYTKVYTLLRGFQFILSYQTFIVVWRREEARKKAL